MVSVKSISKASEAPCLTKKQCQGLASLPLLRPSAVWYQCPLFNSVTLECSSSARGGRRHFVLSPSAPVTLVWILWQGAFWGLVLGTAIGAFRLLAEFFYGPSTCEGGRMCPTLICGLHYLYFGFFLFLVTLLITLAISLATKPISDVHVSVAVRMLWEEFRG